MSRTLEERLASMEHELQQLRDRQQILDCIARNARGCDRHDETMINNSYYADGIDEHGGQTINTGTEYGAWANEVHTRGSLQNMHHITTHTCEIDGDTAHAESYVIGLFLNPDGISARLLAGRYIDRLERRDGEWRIALRRCTSEVMFSGDASVGNSEYFRNMDFLRGLRSPSDVSYQRPLLLDQTPAGHRWPRTMDD